MADFKSFTKALSGLGYVNADGAFHFSHELGPDVVFVPNSVVQCDINTERYTIIVHEDVWILRSYAVINRLTALTGQTRRIHGRACEIKRIHRGTAAGFLDDYHTAGYTNSYYKYGIYFQQELLAVALFAKCRTFQITKTTTSYRSSELTRFACKMGFRIVGGLEKVIQAFCLQHDVAHLMTYADREWTDGKTYFSLGFEKTGVTPPLTFWVNKRTGKRELFIDDTVNRKDWCMKKNLGNIKLELTKNPRT